MEGGGQTSRTRAILRRGMEVFLASVKEACRKRRWRWTLVCCGSRNEACKRFRNARAERESGIVVLLVDSEARVSGRSAIAHLAARDKWDLQGVDEDFVHLMAQTMETWIVADQRALDRYYRQGFQSSALSFHGQNLEEVGKVDIARALNRATERTQKGRYRKIGHASDLLQRIDPMTVRRRCPRCNRLFETLLRLLGARTEAAGPIAPNEGRAH